MTDRDAFRHDRSAYERPTFRYRCGRAAEWGTPCPRGPNPDGSCGGRVGCQPAQTGDRWACRRPKSEGGPCADGPAPDGTCTVRRPACSPGRSMRVWRGRTAVLAALVVVALVAAFNPSKSSLFEGRLNMADPGPLSGAHAELPDGKGCVDCHRAHGPDIAGWLKAAAAPGAAATGCVDCHRFGGDADRPHNAAFETPGGARTTTCVMCHSEHNGREADIVQVADRQCHACHEVKFAHFDSGHPAFGDRYPYLSRPTIRFDHVSHLKKHFEGQMAAYAPEGCTGCHAVDAATRSVPAGGFEQICASCHGEDIDDRPLVVLTLPEFEEWDIDREALLEACGPSLAGVESLIDGVVDTEELLAQEEEYEAVSVEELGPVDSFLFDAESDDPDAYTEPYLDLVAAMTEEGATPLADLVEERMGDGSSGALLAGLSVELARRTACAWGWNEEYESPDDQPSGWFADGVQLAYRPRGHADPVIKAWIDASLQIEDGEAVDAETLTDHLHKADGGPGGCFACHAISERTAGDETRRQVDWRYRAEKAVTQNHYAHGPHLQLLGPGSLCETCHEMDSQVDLAASFDTEDPMAHVSQFKALTTETCQACHNESKVRQDCQLCHRYHRAPHFVKKMF